jgi:hypothetical protein
MGTWKRLARSKIVWPMVTLGILLLFNLFFTPHFFPGGRSPAFPRGRPPPILRGWRSARSSWPGGPS